MIAANSSMTLSASNELHQVFHCMHLKSWFPSSLYMFNKVIADTVMWVTAADVVVPQDLQNLKTHQGIIANTSSLALTAQCSVNCFAYAYNGHLIANTDVPGNRNMTDCLSFMLQS